MPTPKNTTDRVGFARWVVKKNSTATKIYARFDRELQNIIKRIHSSTSSLLLIVISANLGVLLVLVLGDQVADVLVGLLELHLVHALALVPVEEGLALVHGTELGGQALEDALKGRGVGDEGARGGVVFGRDLDDGGLHVVGDPRNEVVGVVLLALLANLVNLLGLHGP